MRSVSILAPAALLGAVLALPAAAQETHPLEVGTVAPGFALQGATQSGVLPDSVHLADFAGKTVVLAFFYQARTKG